MSNEEIELITYTFHESMTKEESTDRHVTSNIKELLDKYPSIMVKMQVINPAFGADSASVTFKISRESFLKGAKCKKYFPYLTSFEHEAPPTTP